MRRDPARPAPCIRDPSRHRESCRSRARSSCRSPRRPRGRARVDVGEVRHTFIVHARLSRRRVPFTRKSTTGPLGMAWMKWISGLVSPSSLPTSLPLPPHALKTDATATTAAMVRISFICIHLIDVGCRPIDLRASLRTSRRPETVFVDVATIFGRALMREPPPYFCRTSRRSPVRRGPCRWTSGLSKACAAGFDMAKRA